MATQLLIPNEHDFHSDDADHDTPVSAEDFLEYYGIEYDPAVVQVNRLHILQRFHQLLSMQADAGTIPADAAARHALQADLLRAAYQEFVSGDARSAKVLRVFQSRQPAAVTISVNDLLKTRE